MSSNTFFLNEPGVPRGPNIEVLSIRNPKLFQEYVNRLKESGCLNTEEEFGELPILTVLKCRSYDKTKMLIDAGADIYLRNSRGRSALHFVGQRLTSTSILKLFIQKVKDDCFDIKEKIAARLAEADWSLHRIIEVRDVEVTRFAFRRGYNIQLMTKAGFNGATPLHVAVRNVDVANVRYLLRFGSFENARDNHDKTPLSCVYDCNQDRMEDRYRILRMLLAQKLEILEKLSDFESLLKYCDSRGMEMLLQHGFDLEITDQKLNNALHFLARNKNPRVIDQMRGYGLDPNVCNSSGVTPLMHAANVGNVLALDFLLEQGANTEFVNLKGHTALFYALEKSSGSDDERRRCVCTLLEYGANPLYDTNDGRPTIFGLLSQECNYWAMQIVLAHLAFQQLKGTPVPEPFLTRIESKDRFRNYFERSKQHLIGKVHDTLDLFDLLTVTEPKFQCYMRFDGFVSNVQACINNTFISYYFRVVLKKRLVKASQIASLKSEAIHIVRIMRLDYKIFPLIADTIINYLDEQSLRNLIDAFTSDDECDDR
ncbi:ankyrin-3-like [Phymastichus coffea]|uniref:ankyrin-3-like n=1 Tax=Phymastichus coffea TaxID=108790 RepID=UPI00273C6EAD|nr:ankyrin-3-like [Phymastichus coffea]